MTRVQTTHKKARKISVTPTWINLKKALHGWSDETAHRVAASGIIEDVMPGYKASEDPDGYLLTVSIKPGEDNELNVSQIHG